MPRYETADIPHTASTDHRILRRAERDSGLAPPMAADLPVVSFYRDRKTAGEAEGDRDLAVALVKLARRGMASAVRSLRSPRPGLGAALQGPDDLVVAEAKGFALWFEGRGAESLAAFETVLARAPHEEESLVGAASAADLAGQAETALGYWRRAVAANPWAPDYRRELVLLLVKKQAWDEAGPECQAWVRLDPMSTEARTARVQCLLAAGDKDEARAEFARLEALAPANLQELQIRFAKKLR
jgi:tetratricopeptide (TPR) repeat protein